MTKVNCNCIERKIKANICKDCRGQGEVLVEGSVYGGQDSHIKALVDTETCDNCRGTGVEPNEDIIKERIYNA